MASNISSSAQARSLATNSESIGERRATKVCFLFPGGKYKSCVILERVLLSRTVVCRFLALYFGVKSCCHFLCVYYRALAAISNTQGCLILHGDPHYALERRMRLED